MLRVRLLQLEIGIFGGGRRKLSMHARPKVALCINFHSLLPQWCSEHLQHQHAAHASGQLQIASPAASECRR